MLVEKFKTITDWLVNSVSDFFVRLFNLNELYENKKSEIDCIEVKKQPSVETGLEELKRLYQEEEGRRTSVDSKSAGLLAVNAILISVFRWQINNFEFKLVKISVISILLVSVLLCLIILLPFPYRTPIVNKQSQVLIQEEKEHHIAEMYKEYFATIAANRIITNYRYSLSFISFLLTAIAIILISIPPLISTVG